MIAVPALDNLRSNTSNSLKLLREDIIKSIDFYEETKKISQKQYRRIKDEFEYYTSIGGNHDVKERFEDFMAEIFGTGQIKMVVSDIESTTKVER